MTPADRGRARAGSVVVIAYGVALAVACGTARVLAGHGPIAAVAAADIAATLVIFLFSRWLDNSSLYDPYWSLAPIAIALAFAADGDGDPARQLAAIGLVCAWGVRLTHNWWRGWGGLDCEDWRYVDLRAQHGKLYWPVSLAGIHLFPTLVVFLGCLPLWPALVRSTPLGPLDAVAAVVTAFAIGLEARADRQLRDFVTSDPAPGEVLATGLWSRSRHPNYLGEMLFWWGLFLFGLAGDASVWWWTLPGAVCITLMFHFVSLPMIEERMRQRRSDYARITAAIPRVLPRFIS